MEIEQKDPPSTVLWNSPQQLPQVVGQLHQLAVFDDLGSTADLCQVGVRPQPVEVPVKIAETTLQRRKISRQPDETPRQGRGTLRFQGAKDPLQGHDARRLVAVQPGDTDQQGAVVGTLQPSENPVHRGTEVRQRAGTGGEPVPVELVRSGRLDRLQG